MKILYVNAMTDLVGGEAYAKGLKKGLLASKICQSGTVDGSVVEFVPYNLFYDNGPHKIQSARLMGQFARSNGISAVVLSGSAKNTSDVGDPFLEDYYFGLRDLIGFRSSFEDWSGPEMPIFGICFGHQALACALGGETSKFKMAWGAKKIALLGRAYSHSMLKPFITERFGKVNSKSKSEIEMVVYHGDHVVRMPAGFHALMTSDYCDVQAMAHDQWPIVSVQAHPEATAHLKEDREDAEFWDPLGDEELNAKDGWNLLGRFIDWASVRK